MDNSDEDENIADIIRQFERDLKEVREKLHATQQLVIDAQRRMQELTDLHARIATWVAQIRTQVTDLGQLLNEAPEGFLEAQNIPENVPELSVDSIVDVFQRYLGQEEPESNNISVTTGGTAPKRDEPTRDSTDDPEADNKDQYLEECLRMKPESSNTTRPKASLKSKRSGKNRKPKERPFPYGARPLVYQKARKSMPSVMKEPAPYLKKCRGCNKLFADGKWVSPTSFYCFPCAAKGNVEEPASSGEEEEFEDDEEDDDVSLD